MSPLRLEAIDKISIYRYAAIMITVGLVIIGCLLILSPFLSAILLAVILCVATWPAFRWLQRQLGGHVGLASLLMTVLLAALFVAPLIFIGSSLVESFHALMDYVIEMTRDGPPILPGWVAGIPYAGPHMVQSWNSLTSDRAHTVAAIQGYSTPIKSWLIVFGSGIGHGFPATGVRPVHFLFPVPPRCGPDRAHPHSISPFRGRTVGAFPCRDREDADQPGLRYSRHGAGFRGIVGRGVLHRRSSGRALLGLAMFFLGIIPGAPPILLVPVILWLFYDGHVGMGVFMIVYSIVSIGLMDVAIKPYFISLGTKMPSILILLGVLGGVATFGFMGLFIGPALLSVAYAMITEWSQPEPVPVIVENASDG